MQSIDDAKAFALQNMTRKGVFSEYKFAKDFANLVTTRKMISRFLKTGNINHRLIINNIICARNVFGKTLVNQVFRMISTDEQFSALKSFLVFLGIDNDAECDTVSANRVVDDILDDVDKRYHLEEVI